MRLYYFTSAVHGLSVIQQKRLKISQLQTLNDPFEFLSPNLSDKVIRRKTNELRAQFSERIGIICFSRQWNHPMMWGHYADNHRGVCLGFDVTAPKRNIKAVNYVRQRSEIDLECINEDKAKAIIDTLISTKFDCWSYEEEVRVLCKLTTPDPVCQLYFKEFGEHFALKELILGCNSQIADSRISSLVEGLENPPQVTKVRPAFKKYEMVRNLRTRKLPQGNR